MLLLSLITFLLISDSKTDKTKQGRYVYVAKTDSELCPVAALRRYYTMANLDSETGQHFIFRRIECHGTSQVLSRLNVPLSYSRFRDSFLEHMHGVNTHMSKIQWISASTASDMGALPPPAKTCRTGYLSATGCGRRRQQRTVTSTSRCKCIE